nr:hypothetical protein [Tanacetum cinerariifolium]
MSLTFANTHNMVAYLNKSDASEGFNQVINFLNASYIKYALTINPHTYVSCIKQFWNTVVMKQSTDVTRLQALVDKKKVVITEATIKEALRLDDAEGVDCLSNEEIFSKLVRMGYEKPSTKLTLYKAFFSSQWKFLIHTILQSMSAKRTYWNEFSSAMKCLRKKVMQKSRFKMMLMMLLLKEMILEALDACTTLTRRVEHLEYDKVAQALEITKLKRRVKKLEKGNKVKFLKLRRLQKVGTSQRIDTSDDTVMEDTSNQGRMIDDLDKDDVLDLMNDKGEEKKEEKVKDDKVKGKKAEIYQIDMDPASKVLSMQEGEPAEVQEVVDVVTTAMLITEVVNAGSELVTAASTTIVAAEPQVPAAPTTAALEEEVKDDKVKGKKAEIYQIDMDHASKVLSMQEGEPAKVQEVVDVVTTAMLITEVVNAGSESVTAASITIVAAEPQVPAAPTTAALVRVVAASTRRRKGVVIRDPRKESITIIPADTKSNDKGKGIMVKEPKPLKKKQQVEMDEDLVKERFSTSKPNNFSDDFLLTTLGAMFERPDGQAQVWKSQRTVYGQAKEIPTLEVYIRSSVKCSEAESGRIEIRTPRAIISDHGMHFCNHQFAEVMLKYGVTRRLAIAYYPQTSGFQNTHRVYSLQVFVRKVQLNELNELRDQAYENYSIYKEKTKRLHDLKIKDRVFNVDDRVLIFNSRPNFKVNGHRLKHYFGEDIPKMVVTDLQTSPRTNEFGDWVKLSDPKQALRGRHPML